MQDIRYCYDVWINLLINGRSDYKAKDLFVGLQESSELDIVLLILRALAP